MTECKYIFQSDGSTTVTNAVGRDSHEVVNKN